MIDAALSEIDGTWVMYHEQLAHTFERIHPGTCVVYAVGDLSFARETRRGAAARDARTTAKLAYTLSEDGHASLCQKRLGDNRFEYRLIKR
jgi:predicted NUDIX family phosphoesterase